MKTVLVIHVAYGSNRTTLMRLRPLHLPTTPVMPTPQLQWWGHHHQSSPRQSAKETTPVMPTLRLQQWGHLHLLSTRQSANETTPVMPTLRLQQWGHHHLLSPRQSAQETTPVMQTLGVQWWGHHHLSSPKQSAQETPPVMPTPLLQRWWLQHLSRESSYHARRTTTSHAFGQCVQEKAWSSQHWTSWWGWLEAFRLTTDSSASWFRPTIARRRTFIEVAAIRRQMTTMSLARAVATVPTPDAPMATPSDTLPDVSISEDEVRQIYRQSSNPGLFEAHLTQTVFTDAMQKHHFNFYGGGALNKQPLSPTRCDVVRRLSALHYPEVVSEGAFKAQVVSNMNDLLRRPEREPVVQDAQASVHSF